jgi:hypothetical protein
MGILKEGVDRLKGALVGYGLGLTGLRHVNSAIHEIDSPDVNTSFDPCREVNAGLAELELTLEDIGWMAMTKSPGQWNFTRPGLDKIIALSRVIFLTNPLIRRAVTVQRLYVWGKGITIEAESKPVQEVLDAFYRDEHNQKVVGDAWPEREADQRIDGNTFFVLYRNKRTGAARVRLIPVDRISNIICNPEDQTEPWYYVKGPSSMPMYPGESPTQIQETHVLLPDIDYNPRDRPSSVQTNSGILKVQWDTPVMHVKTGGLSSMYFGVPELFSTFMYATSYKGVLENFATMMKAYARMAWQVAGLKGESGRADAKSRLNTAVTRNKIVDSNPANTPAGWFLASGNAQLSAVKTSNMTTAPDVARPIRSMVAAGSDTPEHFFGDSDIGNLATSETLDRPTELKMVERQGMWTKVAERFNRKLIEWSTVAPAGILNLAGFRAEIDYNAFDGEAIVTVTPPENESLEVTVTFPNILDRDVTERVRAVVMAATLNGRPAEGVIPDRGYLFKLLMIALGEKNATSLMNKYYPKAVTQGFSDPAEKTEIDRIAADAKMKLGDAAIQQAKVAKIQAEKPEPKQDPKAATGGE